MSLKGHRLLSLCTLGFCDGLAAANSYLDLSLSHDLVHNLVVVLVEHAFVVALLVAQDPQVLGALQLDLKLLFINTDAEKENQTPVIA